MFQANIFLSYYVPRNNVLRLDYLLDLENKWKSRYHAHPNGEQALRLFQYYCPLRRSKSLFHTSLLSEMQK